MKISPGYKWEGDEKKYKKKKGIQRNLNKFCKSS